ncbi:FAD/NAD(P)-binding domain-containing protein [Mytilinidion resinicola]|uniref:FAD/NAD(P)-binding domain-containing protein n=1 Tax=Mytilinidion resinicola TaxID=574789 RepID=A0A6A6YBU2_9PEZI|nr:FAD/NAD(P)-binding domain-containing protein [Mytilinidion resinicola]KAF2805484.1 FAD/NAD(P)-binding domain-containing protein [Mytilinidion resinicola]
MFFLWAVLCVFGFTNALPLQVNPRGLDLPVCIVGAGPAGLAAAKRLESKGKKAVIFEKQAEVGGKCQTYYDKGGFHPLGALLFSNATYTETVKIVDEANVPIYPFSANGGGEGWNYNWTTGATMEIAATSAQFQAALGAEIGRYIQLWNQVFAPISGVGYKKGVPHNLTVSTADWLSTNGFQYFPALIIPAMTPYGYGDFRQVPILYMLQYFTPDIILFFAGQHTGYLVDFHTVFKNFAASLSTTQIHLNTTIEWIDRSGSTPVLRYHDPHPETYHNHTEPCQHPSHTKIQVCSSLIMAFPPTLKALEGAHLDISTEEQRAFGPVGVNTYYSGAVRTRTPYGLAFRIDQTTPFTPPDADGEPVTLIKISPYSDVATTWSWGAYRVPQTIQQAKELLKCTLSKINKDPRNATDVAVPVTDADVVGFRKWDYFPHYDTEQLVVGAYDKFNALQGKQKTYYASGLNGFETIEFAVRAGYDVADSIC